MKRIQDGKNRNPERPIPGCLGRMVNLFDLNTSIGGNRLLTDKPYHDGSSFSRRQSDASMTSLVDDQTDDKVMMSDMRKSPSNKKSNGTPIKMLIAHEMSKEEGSKQSPSNLVAKLMGLDALPQGKSHTRESRSQSGSFEFLQQEHGFMDTKVKNEQGEYKDVYEIWQQSSKPESQNERKMALVREKFMEAKRLSTDEKLRQSKQFQDALEVLSSNKDLFLKFLQEPNSLFSQNLYNLQSVPPPPNSKHITILRPSKLVDKKNENQQMGIINSFDKSHKTSSESLCSPKCCEIDDNPNATHPTRIVVLKPSSMKPRDAKIVSSIRTSNNDEFDVGPEENYKNQSGLRRDETLLSSVFSNGYIGDESSFSKSEIDYVEGTLSDSEVVSPPSRHSWDYINQFNSPYSTSSYSPESSVCREAKKRLSERWAMMASNKNVLEQRQIQRSSSTLGDMLALSDLKKSLEPEEPRGPKPEDADNIPGNLLRSKSVPASASSRLGVEVSSSLNGKAGVMKEKLVKSSSFKGRVSSLFFSKNKKSSKEKFDQSKDEPQSARFPRNIGNDGSRCINDTVIEEESCTRLKQGIILPGAGFCFTKPEISGNPSENQDQPSPISVLEPQFGDDDHTTDSSCNAKLNKHGVESMKYNLIDKSPPIGSIARTLSWDDSTVGSTTPYAGQPSSTPFNPEEEQQECLLYVQTLLSASSLDKVRSNSFLAKWHSPESPLDPSLRDKYINPTPIQSKQRYYQRSITKLVFDCANEALMDIATHGPCTGSHNSLLDDMLLVDRVWAHMKEWISCEERCGDVADEVGGMVVERVVRREVVGRGWGENLRMEIDQTRKEIEGKLLEELVHESLLELTARV